jgi:hypothetical protein
MDIVIDTNLVHSDWKLKSEDFKAFINFVERTNSRIHIPRIVWEETRLNYRNEKAGKLFGGSLVNVPDLKVLHLDYDAETDKYLNWLLGELKIDESNILPYGNYTERIAKRALYKRKPFNRVNNNEYKDSLVWKTVLDILSEVARRASSEVVLISNDGNAFEIDKVQKNSERNQKSERQAGVLHPHLQDDINQIGNSDNRFYFYESLSKFLSAHYTPIRGIDEESVIKFMSSASSTFGEQLWNVLLSDNELLLYPIKQFNPVYKVVADFEQLTIDSISHVEDFYIFHKDGNRVSASCSFYVHITLPVGYSYFVGTNNYDLKHILQVTSNVYYIDGEPNDLRIETVVVVPGDWLELPRPQWNNKLSSVFELYQKAESAFFALDNFEDVSNPQNIDYNERYLASHSKYIPRKVGAESKKRRRPRST